MLFNSYIFILLFLPLCLTGYFGLNHFRRYSLAMVYLLGMSLWFYGYFNPSYLAIIVTSILLNYGITRLMRMTDRQGARKAELAAALLVNFGILFYYKYFDFFIGNVLFAAQIPLKHIVLPLGISFFTFQQVSYVIDAYRGQTGNYSFLQYAAYVAYFPQLIAGPIVRYSDIAPELRSRTHMLSDAAAGTRRFVLGLAKKILFANLLGELVSGFRASQEQSVLYFWLGAAAFTLQIYYDFSGYSDMAIGLGLILGFHFPENFRYPYCAGSITEFWRRWHISLGSWFRDYLYIPLGGNRKGKGRQLLNILLVWLTTGLWHGADWTFVLWGLLYAALLTAEKLFLLRGLKKLRVLNHIYVLLFVTLGFVLFDADSVRSAAASVCAMFGGGGLPLVGQESLYARQWM